MAHATTSFQNPTKRRRFSIGASSFPYLADHGFQGLKVVPGSVYIDLACQVYQQVLGKWPAQLHSVRFQNLIILSGEESAVTVEVEKNEEDKLTLQFFSGPANDQNQTRVATLGISGSGSSRPRQLRDGFSIEQFQKGASVMPGGTFYERLKRNGNEYGPQFQNLSQIWTDENEALAQISTPQARGMANGQWLHPTLLDSVAHALGIFALEVGQAFVFESVDRIENRVGSGLDPLWVHAIRRTEPRDPGSSLLGDIELLDRAGQPCLALSGVRFQYLDSLNSRAPRARRSLDLCIAATFTADPVADSIQFWAHEFDARIKLHFAPYNQVFQQLLGTPTVFRSTPDAANVILLRLEDWAQISNPAPLESDRSKLERHLARHPRRTLPNGMEIAELNGYETDYLYREIFQDQSYLRHGITLSEGDTVIDIGANIGLFSLFVLTQSPSAQIYAFEPSRQSYELLQANCGAYSDSVRTFNCGVSDQSATAEFTFYRNSSVFSGFHPDASEDGNAVTAVVHNLVSAEFPRGGGADALVRELTAERLSSETYTCPVVSVSDIIRNNRLTRIDLLKIDAEKSELAILQGIGELDWSIIGQLVIEVHDRTGATLAAVKRLLSQKGYVCTVEQEHLLADSGLYNIYATRRNQTNSPATNELAIKNAALDRTIGEFCSALQSFAEKSSAPTLVLVCPHSKDPSGDGAPLARSESELLAKVSQISNVYAYGSQAIFGGDPLPHHHDPYGNDLGHIPYTSEGFAAIGTRIFRSLVQLQTAPFKVIALDCDNTLWRGVCGEDGPAGVSVTPGQRFLQDFVLQKLEAGYLLCLCSKNNEQDVWQVFDRPDMPLSREHFVSWRINWNRKSDSLREIARELNLGLESFVFIDDDPLECSEIRTQCPEVLTLQLPQKDELIASFLGGLWMLDKDSATNEDRTRTQLYREEARRDRFRTESPSLRQFIDGLQLEVTASTPVAAQLSRISQLTLRTNQFNFTAIRRSEGEIRDWLKQESHDCFVISVRDRFGDYGLVGVVLFHHATERLVVDTFLLSCRVLGRGVEHAVLASLAQRGSSAAKALLELRYRRTEQNQPAAEFLRSLGLAVSTDVTETSYVLPCTQLAALRYDPPGEVKSQHRPAFDRPAGNTTDQDCFWSGKFRRSETWQRIGDHLSSPAAILRAVESYHGSGSAASSDTEIRPTDGPHSAISKIWRKVLGRTNLGFDDNFFDVGGTSLKAVQLIALLQKELHCSLSITALFEAPTINLLTQKLQSSSKAGKQPGSRITAAALRGQQRRYKGRPR